MSVRGGAWTGYYTEAWRERRGEVESQIGNCRAGRADFGTLDAVTILRCSRLPSLASTTQFTIMAAPHRPRVFLEISIGNEPAGRLTIELFADQTPKTCEK